MPSANRDAEERKVGRHVVELSSLSKAIFPGDVPVTKGELLDYYGAIAPLMLPHTKDRPLMLRRYPQGIGGPGFYQKEMPDYYPDFVQRVTVIREDGEHVENGCVNNAETLVYLANQNAIEIHTWISRRDKLRLPDKCIFDLDPNGKSTFAMVREGALIVRDALAGLDLPSVPMLTGSRGIHVVVPLKRGKDYDGVADWSHGFALTLGKRYRKLFTNEFRKEKRGDRILVDWMRNNYAQTAIAPYSVRAHPGAPCAVPVAWEEVEADKLTLGTKSRRLDPRAFSIRDTQAILARGEMWEDWRRLSVSLPRLASRAE